MKITTFGEIKNGKLSIYGREQFLNSIKNTNDCLVELTLKKKSKGRSNKQNRYYFSLVNMIKNIFFEQHQINYTSEQMHEILKLKCNYVEVLNKDGVIEKFPTSTTELSTVEFEVYLEAVRNWVYDFFDVLLPLPNEQLEIKL